MSFHDELDWGFFVEIDLESEHDRVSNSNYKYKQYVYNHNGDKHSVYINLDTIQECEYEPELEIPENTKKIEKINIDMKSSYSIDYMNMVSTLSYFGVIMTLVYLEIL